MKLNQKNWSCDKKQKARAETIVSQYNKFFDKYVPKNKQYWTMCGQCATPEGKPLDGCEYHQMIKDGFIMSCQFHGVEINSEIHELNVKAFPETNWYNEDFYRQLVKNIKDNDFNPAVVNVDLPKTPDKGVHYISKILSLLTEYSSNVLVVVNVILRMRYYKTKDGNYVLNLLNRFPQFNHIIHEGKWKIGEEYYSYNGAGETGSRTCLGSLIFVKCG